MKRIIILWTVIFGLFASCLYSIYKVNEWRGHAYRWYEAHGEMTDIHRDYQRQVAHQFDGFYEDGGLRWFGLDYEKGVSIGIARACSLKLDNELPIYSPPPQEYTEEKFTLNEEGDYGMVLSVATGTPRSKGFSFSSGEASLSDNQIDYYYINCK